MNSGWKGRTGVSSLWRFTVLVFLIALLEALIGSQKLSASERPKPGAEKSSSGGRAAFIDRLLESSWKKAGVSLGKVATEEEYLRRSYLDLLGRIPTVQEANAYLQTKETDKREKLVDFLLEHADYPKNLATQWTILLVGRGNQGRRVDRGALATGCASSSPPIAHGTTSFSTSSRPPARTSRTGPSTIFWLILSSTRCH